MKDEFRCSRMNKILYSGAVRVKRLERIGVGVKVAEDKRQEMRDIGCEGWVIDHYGLMGELQLDVSCLISEVKSARLPGGALAFNKYIEAKYHEPCELNVGRSGESLLLFLDTISSLTI